MTEGKEIGKVGFDEILKVIRAKVFQKLRRWRISENSFK